VLHCTISHSDVLW